MIKESCIFTGSNIAAIANYVRSSVTLSGLCIAVAFIVVFIVIGAMRATAGGEAKPRIRFLATRDNREWWRDFSDRHNVTFVDIRVNDGAGMHTNGFFIAPVDGVYW